MTWNWQLPDWPDFPWDQARLAPAEQQFLIGGGVLLGTVKHTGEEERNQLTVEAMSTEAVTTSEIEGEILDRASVQSSIQKQLGLAADNRRVAPKEQGMAEIVVDLYRTFSAPLSEEMIFGWHRMLMSGRRDIKDVGRYRSSDEAMQVVSGAIGAPKIHFEAPPSAEVPREMAAFIDWFKRTAPGETRPLPALTREGPHICISRRSIRLRTATAESDRPLPKNPWPRVLVSRHSSCLLPRYLRGEQRAIMRWNRRAKRMKLPTGLRGSLESRLKRGRRTLALIEFLIEKAKLFDRLKGQLNERQQKALLRMSRKARKDSRAASARASTARLPERLRQRRRVTWRT